MPKVERRSTDKELFSEVVVLRHEISRLRVENNKLSHENTALLEAHQIAMDGYARAQRRLAELTAEIQRLVGTGE